MKCELCHKNTAETALVLTKDGREKELYVCRACAKAAQAEAARSADGVKGEMRRLPNGVELTVSGTSPDGNIPPEEMAKVVSAMDSLFSHLKNAAENGVPLNEALSTAPQMNIEAEDAKAKGRHLALGNCPVACVIRDRLHLEGLFHTYEMSDVAKACRAQNVFLVPYNIDGFTAAGHVYEVRYTGSKAAAEDVVNLVLERELHARTMLFGEMARSFGDSFCRALAILKSCRMLSQGEYFDLLSPVRIAAIDRLLDGLTRKDVDMLMESLDLSGNDALLSNEEADKRDEALADAANECFRTVALNARGERIFL